MAGFLHLVMVVTLILERGVPVVSGRNERISDNCVRRRRVDRNPRRRKLLVHLDIRYWRSCACVRMGEAKYL